MNITISNNIVVENPSTELISWCKTNLRLSNPEYAKKARMGFWIGDTPKRISLYETRGDNLILPYGAKDLIPSELLDESVITYDFPNDEVINYNAKIPLRNYQERAVNNMLIAGHGILQAPAGSGKSRCGISLFTKWKTRTLWLCHTKDLINQAKTMAEEFIDKDLIGTITEGKVNIGKGVTFATVQTMCKLDLSQYKNLWGTILVDECFKGDTEVLTDEGFKRFDMLTGSERVAQYTEDGKIEFIGPLTYIKRHHTGTLVKFTVKYGRDIYMTSNHIQPMYYPAVGRIKRETIGEISMNGSKNLIVSGNGTGNNARLTPLERIAIASQADGTVQRVCRDHTSWTIHLKKDRKISRFMELVNAAGIPWREIKSSREGYTRFAYETPTTITKNLTDSFDIEMGADRADDFIREICKWDGSEMGRYDYYYSSKVKENTEFVSAIAFLAGYQSSLVVEHDTRKESYSDIYRVYGNKKKYSDVQKCKKRFVPYEGDVYCVEVPSHMIVVRADGFAFVSGNCHRVSGSPTRITQYQKVLNNLSARHKYGLSATVHRADGLEQCMFSLVGKVAYQVPDEAVAENIMQVGICRVGTGIEISREALNTDGTINYARLINYLTTNDTRNDIIHHTFCDSRQYSSLILSERLEQLRTMFAVLPIKMKENAVIIHGKQNKAEREKALDDMRTGKKKYLFATYQLAKEGLDIPCLERLYMASPVKDYAVVTQAIGRIARTCEGKSAPICYDFVDNIGYCIKAYKQRVRTYKKNNCYFVEE